MLFVNFIAVKLEEKYSDSISCSLGHVTQGECPRLGGSLNLRPLGRLVGRWMIEDCVSRIPSSLQTASQVNSSDDGRGHLSLVTHQSHWSSFSDSLKFKERKISSATQKLHYSTYFLFAKVQIK